MICAYGQIFFIGAMMEALSTRQGGQIIKYFILCLHIVPMLTTKIKAFHTIGLCGVSKWAQVNVALD